MYARMAARRMRREPTVGTVGDVRTNPVSALVARFRQMPPWRLDFALATLFVLIGVGTTGRNEPVYEPRDGYALALALVATVPFYVRRLAPLPVFLISITATAALFAGGYDAGALPFVVAAGAYTVGAYRPLPEVVFAAIYMYVGFVVMLLADNPGFGGAEFITSVPLFGGVMFVGWTMQARRLRYDALEREHGQAQERAAAEERLRIAQELHDVIGHSLGLIAVQAGVGMHVIDRDPDEAKRALEHISRTSRSSLAEIRRLLGLVRAGEGGNAYAPTPGLADLQRLREEVAGAGLSVDLELAEDAMDLPPGVELAAYRIVQEALTNTVRHADAHRATVQLDVDGGTLHVVVTDDGRGSNGSGRRSRTRAGGHGLVGMRERVAVYGGSLEVGPNPGGGYRVEATLLFDEDRS
jgi:signal transduction histidine kinase